MSGQTRPPLSREEFIEWVRREGEHRYHDHHRYHHLMHRRVLAWEKHYPWISKDTLEYFRSRPPLARQDSMQAIDYVTTHATSYEQQERCVAALIRKTEILWHLLDCLWAAYVEPGWG